MPIDIKLQGRFHRLGTLDKPLLESANHQPPLGESVFEGPMDEESLPMRDRPVGRVKETVVAALRLNHISLRVRNLATSAQFYQEALLLPEIACGAGKPNIRWFGLGEGQSLHLIEGEFGKTFVTMSTHFCISTTDFEQALQHLRRTGISFCNLAGEVGKEHVRADGQRSVYLQDPDGYWVEVNGDY